MATQKVDLKQPKFNFRIGKVAKSLVDIEVHGEVEPNHDLTELKRYSDNEELSKEDQKWWPPNKFTQESYRKNK